MGTDEKQLKGAVLLGYFKFIRKKWGKAGLDQCIQSVGLEESKIKEGHWYSHRHSHAILGWIASEKGEEFLRECGNHTVKDLGILSYIVRFMDIESILKKGRRSYSDAFNYGKMRIETEKSWATIKIKGNAQDDRHACMTWTGVFEGMLQMTRTKGTVKKTACQTLGAEWCEWEMDWSEQ